jgi:hypothetical protein
MFAQYSPHLLALSRGPAQDYFVSKMRTGATRCEAARKIREESECGTSELESKSRSV